MQKVFLKPGREKSIQHHHPWIFSGAIDRVEGSPEMGETVSVCTGLGEFVAWAAYSPNSQIRLRIWSTQESESIDREFFRARLLKAMERRKIFLADGRTNAVRLVYAESDGLPGLVIDQYADHLVLQALSAGAERWKSIIAEIMAEETGAACIYERSDVEVRRLEGLSEAAGLLHGSEPASPVEIFENGLRFQVDVRKGHKTGFYLDQRPNRARLCQWSAGKEVLNCFSYSGAFSIYALAGGAQHVLSVDTSAEALAYGAEHTRLNGLAEEKASWLEGDVFQALRTFRDQARSFDLIVLDPPKFAFTAAQVERAARGYKDINLLAFKLLRPGGVLFTFSCSGAISAELFQKIIAGAALDAGVDGQILETMTQGPDHPVALNFPEGAYLKGLICRV